MFSELIKSISDIASAEKEYWELTAIEKLSLIASFLIISSVSIITFSFCILFCSLALILLFREMTGSLMASLFITSGLNLVIILSLILFRDRLVINPMIRFVTRFIQR
ncbi:MAG: hypothetical protein WCU80_07965 [Paludibacteraceae bacterium]